MYSNQWKRKINIWILCWKTNLKIKFYKEKSRVINVTNLFVLFSYYCDKFDIDFLQSIINPLQELKTGEINQLISLTKFTSGFVTPQQHNGYGHNYPQWFNGKVLIVMLKRNKVKQFLSWEFKKSNNYRHEMLLKQLNKTKKINK